MHGAAETRYKTCWENSHDTAQVECSMHEVKERARRRRKERRDKLVRPGVVGRFPAVVKMHVMIIVISGIVEPELFKSFSFRNVASW